MGVASAQGPVSSDFLFHFRPCSHFTADYLSQAIAGLLPSISRADGILSSFVTLLRTCAANQSSLLLSSLLTT